MIPKNADRKSSRSSGSTENKKTKATNEEEKEEHNKMIDRKSKKDLKPKNVIAKKNTNTKVKTTSGTISRASRNRIENLTRIAYQRAKVLLPGLEISNRGAYTLASMLEHVTEKIINHSLDVFSGQGRKIVNVSDVSVAMNLSLPASLAAPAIIRGAGLIGKRHGTSNMVQEVLDTARKIPAKIRYNGGHTTDPSATHPAELVHGSALRGDGREDGGADLM